MIDATIVASALDSPIDDAGEVSVLGPDAGFTKKNGETYLGYKAHAAMDKGSGLIRMLVTTTAKFYDSQACDALVLGDEAAVYAVKAYDDAERRKPLKDRNIQLRVFYKAGLNRPLRSWQKSFNKAMAVIRAPVERPFAMMKGPFGFARCRFLCLARNDAHMQQFGCAFNLKAERGLLA